MGRHRKPEKSTERFVMLFTPEEKARTEKLQRRGGYQYVADLIRELLEREWIRSETERKAKLAEKKAST